MVGLWTASMNCSLRECVYILAQAFWSAIRQGILYFNFSTLSDHKISEINNNWSQVCWCKILNIKVYDMMEVLFFYENGWFYKFGHCVCAFLIHKRIRIHLLIVKPQVRSWFWYECKWNLHMFLTLFSVSNNFHSVFRRMSGSGNDVTSNLESLLAKHERWNR